jgi:hypothetical protein
MSKRDDYTRTEFTRAINHATQALLALSDLPPGLYMDWAKDNMQAGLGWLRQAHNEWLTEQANHE